MFKGGAVGVIGLLCLWLLLGSMTSALTNSDNAFEYRPLLTLLFRLNRWLGDAWHYAQHPHDSDNPAPITQVAPEAARKLGSHFDPDGIAAGQVNDIRLAVCPEGSLEPQAAIEIEPTTFYNFYRSVQTGVTYPSLLDIQGALGEPACNTTRPIANGTETWWRYLGPHLAIIDIRQRGERNPVTIHFTNTPPNPTPPPSSNPTPLPPSSPPTPHTPHPAPSSPPTPQLTDRP